MSKTLYEKYGGFRTVSRVVMTFYDKALESDQIGDYFEAVDMKRLIDHQTKFISAILGGPASYSDERLRQVHAPLELSHADYDEMAALLAEALAEHGFAPPDIQMVIAEIEARRAPIIGKGRG
ncbi:group 1 truncated hemoglobin [Limibaculum sp. FT325]|uniref:truncated hemoglobin n=1 Tax=Thermohalobaculum sediminis TaxID=2939436 RepID=UPI0020C0F4D3|nr:group 1 truncated hemoglobin [Limibaculum sediminis]MCL5777364.1 group 1 truncated hemoglobin [Limibaculum sediminis]